MANNLEKLQQDFDELQRKVNERLGSDSLGTGPASGPSTDFAPPPTPPPSPTSNQQLRNGDANHSVNTYKDAVAAPATDKVLECAYWFSSDGPAAAGQTLDVTTDSETSSVNDTLKAVGHSTYSATRCDWDSVRGNVRMTGLSTLDALLSGSPVGAGRTEYFGSRVALRNSQIVVPAGGGIAAMLYDNNALDFMKAGTAFHLSGVRRGPVTGVTERRYKILAETDRGYSYLSDEYIDANAPDDSSFTTSDEYLTWDRIDGVLKYKVYRFDVTAGKYRLLHEVTSGSNTFGDNGTIEAGRNDEGGYPVATHDRVICYVATLDGALSTLAVDGVDDWDDLWLNIPVPDPLASAASGNQVFRLALTMALDRKMVDAVSTAGSVKVGSATGDFTALDTGRIGTLYDADGNILHGPEALTFDTTTEIDFATPVATDNVSATLYIVGGGDHGLLVDLLHLSYQDRAKFSFWPEDRNRTLEPTAAPTTTGQGGIGTGGGGGDPGDGGLGGCIPLDCPTWVYEGNHARAIPFSLLRRGMAMFSGNLVPNWTLGRSPLSETDNLHVVSFENGVWVPCSPRQPFYTSMVDREGTMAHRLKPGDFAVTVRDGRVETSRIVEVLATGKPAKVGTPHLSPGHSYVAGYLKLPWYEQLWRWLWPKDRGPSGGILHNRKPLEP